MFPIVLGSEIRFSHDVKFSETRGIFSIASGNSCSMKQPLKLKYCTFVASPTLDGILTSLSNPYGYSVKVIFMLCIYKNMLIPDKSSSFDK
jgi:hypothetical protein